MKNAVTTLALGAMLLVSANVAAMAAGHGQGSMGADHGQAPMGAASSSAAPGQTIPTTTRSPAHVTGQPSQECGSATAPNRPGHAATAPGSAFNPDGKAGSVYAGEQPQNSRNTASVSQYDTACAHQP